MAKKPDKFRGLPMAPQKVKGILATRLWRMGRSDAKKYENLRDFTRTHAIIQIDKLARTGQHNVNQWLNVESEPISSGNVRIRVQLSMLGEELADLKGRRDDSGRQRQRTLDRIQRVLQEIGNFKAQHESNMERGYTLRRLAAEGLDSWKTYRENMAAIYTRSRAIASGLDVSSVRAEIPEFESVELVEIPELEDELIDPPKTAPRTTTRRVIGDDPGASVSPRR